jgi:hypothetical protein
MLTRRRRSQPGRADDRSERPRVEAGAAGKRPIDSAKAHGLAAFWGSTEPP